jgi:hypothetical protein
MKTRKYFYFVCILMIFTVVFSSCRSGTREDGEDDWDSEPKFRLKDLIYEDRLIIKKRIQMAIMGTFDEPTWRGIELRFNKALRWQFQYGFPVVLIILNEKISDDILLETFSYEVEEVYIEGPGWVNLQSSPDKGAIVLEGGYNNKNIDYEWYKVTGERTLYELSGDERYDNDTIWVYGKEYPNWNRFGNVLYINYNKINELLVPIEDDDGEYRPALAVAILALHKAVTTGVLSQK